MACLLRCLWRRGLRDIEVLRAEVDRAGYDLVLESNGVLRHVQLKASYRYAKTARVGININLAQKPSGCVLWIWFDPDSMDLGHVALDGAHGANRCRLTSCHRLCGLNNGLMLSNPPSTPC